MFKSLIALFKKKEPYWNEFDLKNIPGPTAKDGFNAAIQNIASDGAPLESRQNLVDFVESIPAVPGTWDSPGRQRFL